MVDILQKQTRHYTPDMTSANFVASGAQEMKDWSGVFKQIGSISDSIGQAQKQSEALAVKQQKEAEQAQKLAQTEMENADTTMIDTQIGNMPQTELMRWNVEQIQAGVDPTTPEYSQKLMAKREEIYRPFIENMQTQKGRDKLMKQGLDTQERLRQSNLGKIAENRKKALAQAAFVDSAKTQAQEARDFGKNGDWKGYQDASKDTRKAMADYIAAQAAAEAAKMQAAGIDPQAVIESQQLQAAQAKLDATKADAKQMQADIDALRKKVYQDVEKVNPNASEKQKEKVFKDLYPEEAKAYPKTKKQKGNVEVLKRREFVPGLLEEINDLGIAEDEAQINFFDRIDVFRDKGMSEDEAIQTVFDANPGNKFGDVDTLKRIYEKYSQGEILEFTKLKKKDFAPGLLDKLNNMGIDEDVAQLNFFDRIDELKSKGMKEDKAIQAIFEANPNNKFGDVSTLKDFYDMYQGRYSDSKERPTEQEVVATAKQKSKAKPKKTKTRQQVATDVAVQKKLMKGGNDSKQAAEYIVDTQSIQSYMSGLAEEDPQKAIMMLGDKETIMKNQQEELAKENVSWGNKLWGLAMNASKFVPGGVAAEQLIKEQSSNPEAWYEASGLEKQGREELNSVIPDSVRQVKTEVITTQAKQEQQGLKDRLKNLERGSEAYAIVEKQIKDLQSVIDDPTDKVLDSVREDLETSVLPEARKNFDLQKLAVQEREAKQTVETYTMSLSPDKETSNAANFALLFGQPAAESMFNMSIAPDEMYKSWERFYENGNKVEFNKEVTFEGTKSVADALADLTNYQGNNPLEVIKYAMDAQSALAESGQMTQGQKDEVRQILNTAVQDKAFADMTSDIFNNKDRYYPDISWFAKTFAEPAGGVDLVGLPSNRRNVDIDELEKYVKVETSRATQDTIARLAVAAQMQDPEMRKQAVIEAGEFLVGEKRRIFDHAMDNYGIDMQALREAKRTRGQAFTQVGTSVKEYMGDDPSTGEPIWRDMRENKEAYKAAIIRALLGNKPETKSAQGE